MHDIIKIREKELEDLARKLDLTKSMYDNAKEKYNALGEFFENSELEMDFFPQGSFILGTTVRPYSESEEKNYDLDSICQVNITEDKTDPKIIREKIDEILESSGIYKDKITFYDRCITINYADYGKVGFSIDVVPAVLASESIKNDLKIKGCDQKNVDTSIEIIHKESEKDFDWINSNPKAYFEWFNNINFPFTEYLKEERLKKIVENNKTLYNSVEEIPPYFDKTVLQMCIQILKRARDVYFSKIGKEKYKPISAIITTIVMDTAERGLIGKDFTISQVIKIIINELKAYSKYKVLDEREFKICYFSKVTIKKENGNWIMNNPVNPKDNLVDSWNKDKTCEILFFEWIDNLEKSFEMILNENNNEYSKEIAQILSYSFVNDYYNFDKIKKIDEGPKPWSK